MEKSSDLPGVTDNTHTLLLLPSTSQLQAFTTQLSPCSWHVSLSKRKVKIALLATGEEVIYPCGSTIRRLSVMY